MHSKKYVICNMNKRFGLIVTAILFVSVVLAQIPELNIVKSTGFPENSRALIKARIAYNNGEYQLAEKLFFTASEKTALTDLDNLLFANTLLKDNKPALAKEFYTNYFSNVPGEVQQKDQLSVLLESEANQFKRKAISTSDAMSASLYQNNLFECKDGKLYSYDFDCEQNINNKDEVVLGSTDMKLSSISYYANGTMAIACYYNELTDKFGLYLLRSKNDKWSSPKKILADKLNNYAFPMVDEKNNMLYFSSDKSGGYGGYDLYQSVIGSKSVETPLNLGPEINTTGHEISPYKGGNWLYYSTNGKLSKGGFDIFKYNKINEENFILLNYLNVNTMDDDLLYLPYSSQKCIAGHIQNKKYVISTLEKASQSMFIKGIVMDENKSPINNATLLFETDENFGRYVATNAKGEYNFTSEDKKGELLAMVIAEGYLPQKIDVVKTNEIILEPAEQKELIVEKVHTNHFSPSQKVVEKKSSVESTTQTVTTTYREVAKEDPINLISAPTTNPYTLKTNDLFYIIIGSTATKQQAETYLLKWINRFDNLEIMISEKGMYRIGFYAGMTENEAKYAYDKARKVKSEVWILRPKR